MTFRLIFVIISLFISAAGCTTMNPKPNPLDTRPADFNVAYDWREGSLPPPYHYEYTIMIKPDGQGQIVMIPDYPSSTTPTWTETFTVTPTALDRFYRLLVDNGLFAQGWQAEQNPPVGGSYDSLDVTAHGRQVSIPSFVIPAQRAAADDISKAIRALVPQDAWDKLDTQRKQYVTDFRK
jgi:hypothetical protein